MLMIFVSGLVFILLGAFGLWFFANMRSLNATRISDSTLLFADRYRPMLRLLSDQDLDFVASNPQLRKQLRSRRRRLFRGYLRCLTKDYAQLLAGVRQVIADSATDRPDLVRAIAKNRFLFALTICKIEFRLTLHATGVGTVDIANLVQSVELLRTQVRALSAPQMAA